MRFHSNSIDNASKKLRCFKSATACTKLSENQKKEKVPVFVKRLEYQKVEGAFYSPEGMFNGSQYNKRRNKCAVE